MDAPAPAHTSATALSSAALALVLLGTLGAFLGLLPPGAGFRFALLGAVLGLPAMGWALRRDGIFSRAAALALPPVLALAALVISAAPHPVIRDVSTDLRDPPIARTPGLAEDLAAPHSGEVRSVLNGIHKDLVGRVLPGGDPAGWTPKVLELLKQQGWDVVAQQSSGGVHQLHAVVTSRLFRFQDDVLVRLRPEPGGGTRLDIRSASRIGKSDLGANAARIRELLSRIDGELGAKRP